MTLAPTLARLACAFLVVSSVLLGTTAVAEEEITRFKGGRSTQTAIFEVDGPWLLDWRTNSDYRGYAAFELTLLDGPTRRFHSRIMKRGRWLGNGLKLFEEGGRYRFDVVSTFTDYTLIVIQLTEEEAAAYSSAQN